MAQTARAASQRAWQEPRKLNQDDVGEIRKVVRWELSELSAGREENVLLIEALANQWSAERILSVAQQRGKNWRFLAALTDKALQAQGVGLLVAIAESTGMDLTEQLMRKSYSVLDRINKLYAEEVRRSGDDPFKAEIYDSARQAVVDTFKQGTSLYYQQAGQLILHLLKE